MNALAIALHGVGYPALITALQGLLDFEDEQQGSGGGTPSRRVAVPHARPLDEPMRGPGGVQHAEQQETSPQEASASAAGPQTLPRPRSRAAEPASGQREASTGKSAAQMLRAELAAIDEAARAREAAALLAITQHEQTTSAEAAAAETAALAAARKRDNQRRAQIAIALLMLS